VTGVQTCALPIFKPFFLVVPTEQPTADQREARLVFSLSFLERFCSAIDTHLTVVSSSDSVICKVESGLSHFRSPRLPDSR